MPSEKTTESRRGRRDRAQADHDLDAKEAAPQPRRKSRRPRRQQASPADREADKRPDRKEQERATGDEAPKPRNNRSRRSRTKAADKEP